MFLPEPRNSSLLLCPALAFTQVAAHSMVEISSKDRGRKVLEVHLGYMWRDEVKVDPAGTLSRRV